MTDAYRDHLDYSLNELLPMARKSYHILIEELQKDSIEFKLAEAFIPTGLKTTGVKGDQRVYGPFLAIAIHRHDGKLFLDYDFLRKVSNRITNEVDGLVRVIYFLGSKNHKPGTSMYQSDYMFLPLTESGSPSI